MSDAASAELLKLGFPGVVILMLGFACLRLWLDNRNLQALRVEDAKAVQAQLLANNTQCVTALTNAANSMEAQAQCTKELKDAITLFGEDQRRRRI